MRSILRFFDRHLEEILGSILLVGMALIAFINVIVRYGTTLSFSASEELTVNGFVWVVLLGTSLAFREGTNFGMNLVFNALPKRLQDILLVLGSAACLAFFFALGYEGIVEVMDEVELSVSSDSLAIPVWIYTSAIPIGSLLVIVRIVQHLVSMLRLNQHEIDLEESH